MPTLPEAPAKSQPTSAPSMSPVTPADAATGDLESREKALMKREVTLALKELFGGLSSPDVATKVFLYDRLSQLTAGENGFVINGRSLEAEAQDFLASPEAEPFIAQKAIGSGAGTRSAGTAAPKNAAANPSDLDAKASQVFDQLLSIGR